jgi:hypothetical protein
MKTGLLMTCEVEPADEMIVRSAEGKKTVLQPLPAGVVPVSSLKPSSAVKRSTSAKKVRLVG